METIHLEKQGETFRFTSPDEPGTGRVDFELTLAPGKVGPSPHIHTKSDEGFEVISGKLIMNVDGEEHVLGPGNKIIARAGQVHTFKNGSSSEPVIVNIYVEPALNFRWFIRESARLANENGGSWDDLSLLHGGYLLFKFRDEYRLGGIPFFLQDILFGLLAGVAKITGHTKSISPLPFQKVAVQTMADAAM